MSCNSEEILLYVDGELAPDDAARVRAHIASCDACRDLLLAEQSLDCALGGLGDIDPPEDFAAATVTKARCDLTHAVRSRGERVRAAAVAFGLSAAAIAMLWPTGVLDPVLSALAPLRCLARFTVARIENSATGAFLVGRTISRYVFDDSRVPVGAAALLLALLVTTLVWLLSRYHAQAAAGGRGPAR